jgi:AraC family transcriptional regulator of adaptative response/methylated-DNA-[protein]-cysteine methyltransferase
MSVAAYATPDLRWKAIVDRNFAADGAFVYAVKTTGVCCRPSCSSRKPLQKNVAYFDTCPAAIKAGYRPCRRCRPLISDGRPEVVRLIDACRLLESDKSSTDCQTVAARVGLSPQYFQRFFKKHLGITPREYRRRVMAERSKQRLSHAGSVSDAVFGAGYSSSSRFYEGPALELGMKPSAARDGAPDQLIRYSVQSCSLGKLMIAWTEVGVCEIQFADQESDFVAALVGRFHKARVERVATHPWVDSVMRVINRPQSHEIPLDIQGTAFQQRVWSELRRIPPGATKSYAELAQAIGAPKSARAVGSAVAANRLAVVVPCHRVVRGDGSASGFRWGVERKKSLLAQEAKENSREQPASRKSRRAT